MERPAGQGRGRAGGGQSVASIGKLGQARIVKLAARLGIDIIGAHGLLAGADGVEGGAYAEAFVFSPSSIYGGTDEIQRNIVAERSLGLPREPAPTGAARSARSCGTGPSRPSSQPPGGPGRCSRSCSS